MMHRKFAFLLASLALFTGLLSSSSIQATPISYGNFVAPTITFLNVTESTQSPPPDSEPMFGAPSLSVLGTGGAKLSFLPTSFSSTANAGSIDITDGLLSFTMVAPNSLSSINSLTISEKGTYLLAGTGTATTLARSRIVGFVTIKEIAGVSVPDITIPFTVAPFQVTGPVAGVNDGTWSLNTTVNIASVAANVTRATFSMNNQLLTLSETGSLSFIDKKDFVISTDGDFVIIPEPSTFLASGMLMGIFGIAFYQRRQLRSAICSLL